MIPRIARAIVLAGINAYMGSTPERERVALLPEISMFCSRLGEWSGAFIPEWMIVLALLEEERKGRIILA